MNEQITSAAELDALPARTLAENANTLIRKALDGTWQTLGAGGSFWWDSGHVAAQPPWTVLYRPDQPQRVQPSREDVAEAILAHFHAPDSLHGTWWLQPRAAADAVLALFAQQPTVAEVKAEALPVVDTKVIDGLRAAETRLRFIQHHWPADTCAEVLVMLERLNADRLEAEALSEADRIEREARP